MRVASFEGCIISLIPKALRGVHHLTDGRHEVAPWGVQEMLTPWPDARGRAMDSNNIRAALGPLLGSYRIGTELPRGLLYQSLLVVNPLRAHDAERHMFHVQGDCCIGLLVFFCSFLSVLVSSPRFFPFLTSESARTSKTLHIFNMPRRQRTNVANHISYPPYCLANASDRNCPNPTRTMLRLKSSSSSIDSYPPKC